MYPTKIGNGKKDIKVEYIDKKVLQYLLYRLKKFLSILLFHYLSLV